MSTVVPFKARGVRAELREALDQRIPLRVQRERLQPGVIHGYVVGLSRDFCLIAEVGDAMRFDGYIAIAVSDISALEHDPSRCAASGCWCRSTSSSTIGRRSRNPRRRLRR
jgi:hypothetical protein